MVSYFMVRGIPMPVHPGGLDFSSHVLALHPGRSRTCDERRQVLGQRPATLVAPLGGSGSGWN